MTFSASNKRSVWSPRRTALGLAAAGLAGVVMIGGLLAWELRGTVREELVQRDAEVLYSYLLLRQAEVETNLLLEPDLPMAGELLDLVLEASRLRGVLGVRLANADGEWVEAVPFSFVGHLRLETTRPNLSTPQAAFLDRANPGAYLFGAADSPVPLLEIRLPLTVQEGEVSFTGEAQFLLDASALAARLATLDRQIGRLALSLTGLAALGLGLLALWAARHLERSAATLALRQADLGRAQAELALSSRTAAIGALAGHLVHGLKNPLVGLESFVALGDDPSAPVSRDDWRDAVDAARRMRSLLTGVLDALRTEAEDDAGEVTGSGLLVALRDDLALAHEPAAAAFVRWPEPPAALLPARLGALVRVVLTHLLHNALQAAPGTIVTLSIESASASRWRWSIADSGPGLPEMVRRRLFLPVTSGKPNGSGLGLALAAQLARAADGELRLAATGPTGTLFEFEHPGPG